MNGAYVAIRAAPYISAVEIVVNLWLLGSQGRRVKAILMGQRLVVGILGGMGPEATVDLFSKIVRSTPVSVDQDHLRIIIDNNPTIPDRQRAILEDGPSPALC